MSGAPSVERELSLSHTAYVTFAFTLPLMAAAVLEAAVALLSDVWSRGRLVVLGQASLAASLLFAASTRSAWGLALSLALAGTSSGVACGGAQAMLVTSSDGGAERAMARWAVYSALGDVLTPLLTGGALALGHSYRAAMAAIGIVVLVQCAFSMRSFWGRVQGEDADEEEPGADPLRIAIARAMRIPRLWAWLFAAASCTLLDELVIALAALRMVHDRAGGPAFATGAAVAFSIGVLVGAATTDKLVARFSSRAILSVSASLCVVAVLGLVATGSPIGCVLALFAAGVTAAPHHPLAFARAYDELPDYPGTVQAIAQVFVVVEVGAPLALGLVADRLGLGAALACLLVQPVVVLALALALSRRTGTSTPTAQPRE